MRAADLGEDLALHGGAGQAAELGDEFPHGAITAERAITCHVSSEIALQPALVIPMRAGWIARSPFLPARIRGFDVDEVFAVPDPVQGQMRIEEDIGLNEEFEPALRVLQQPF